MNKILIRSGILLLILMIVLLSGCNPGTTTEALPGEGTPTKTLTVSEDLTVENRFPERDVVYQWGVGAEASSEFSNTEWNAEQAVGEPDSPGCGDYQFSWASAASDSIDTLIVRYPESVYPLEIIIHESFNPDQIVKIEVLNAERGTYYTVLQKNPLQVDRPCPFELSVPVSGINFSTNTVRITVDQSQLGLGWNEIDAVQLIGTRGDD